MKAEELKECIRELTEQMEMMQDNLLEQIKENRIDIVKGDEKSEEIIERIGGKGVPTVKDLVKKLNEINGGMESAHEKMLKVELKEMEQRLRDEYTRIDLRINDVERDVRLQKRETEREPITQPGKLRPLTAA